MWFLEAVIAAVFYYIGYLKFCEGDTQNMLICAALSGFSFLLSIRRLKYGRYVNMSMKKIDKLSGKAFENYLAVQFRRLGYRVSLTEDTNDYGADLILKKRGKTIVVQAKRYDRNIGISAVQEAVGSVAYYEADGAMVVTNQYFTKNAKNLARQNEVDLWGREEIRKKFKIRR